MEQNVIITAALIGNGTTKEMNPAAPYTAEELAADAVRCVRAGASVIHIHVRDEAGKPTFELGTFVRAHNAIREALDAQGLDAVINLSTGGKGTLEERMAPVRYIRPEMCSYNPGSINWGSFVYYNPPELMEQLGALCLETGTKPEIEIFDLAMFRGVEEMVKRGFLREPCYYQFIMNIPNGLRATLKNIAFLKGCLPEGARWSITGIGRDHMPAVLAALAAGADGIRCGLEDGIWLKKGVYATNESYVRQLADLVRMTGRGVATAQEARGILGLKGKTAPVPMPK